MVNRGRFITVEGAEGAGKTTQLPLIREYLEKAGHSILQTREPGGTALGEALRGLLLAPTEQPMASDTELLLMFAARAEHLDKVVKPAIAAGQWVLCDRFTDATYAYQGGGRGIDVHRITVLEQWVQGELRPDLTLVLDVPLEIGRERVGRRGNEDRFEREQDAFFNRVRNTYLERARRNPERYRVIDTSGGITETTRAIQNHLEQAL